MTVKSTPSLRSVAVLLVAGMALAGAGCGRKADPELPTVQKATAPSPVGIPVAPLQPQPQPQPKAATSQPNQAPDGRKPFVLDFLL